MSGGWSWGHTELTSSGCDLCCTGCSCLHVACPDLGAFLLTAGTNEQGQITWPSDPSTAPTLGTLTWCFTGAESCCSCSLGVAQGRGHTLMVQGSYPDGAGPTPQPSSGLWSQQSGTRQFSVQSPIISSYSGCLTFSLSASISSGWSTHTHAQGGKFLTLRKQHEDDQMYF